jgi:alpha-1,3-rhamnosyl/mannosyltransferase
VPHELQVLVDGRPLVGERTGIGVHTAEIAGRLAAHVTIGSHVPIDDRTGIERCDFRVDRAINGIVWQQLVLPRISEADVLWGPHGTLPVAGNVPAVVSLHDFTSLTTPGRHRFKTIVSFNLFIRPSLDRARRIAAVSRSVAGEAVRWFGVSPKKIEIVRNGVDEFFSPGDATARDYVLFVGTLEPRKGLDVLLEAWNAIPQPKPRLVLCGSAGWGGVKPVAGVEWTGFVDRARLRDLYRGALVFVYPSREEGFGIPPLEAMACGAPVIATRTGAIPEFAGDAAMIVEPGDAEGLRDALRRVLRDAALRDEMRHRGPVQASQFRWEPSAAKMMELLTEAAGR